jgi:ferredoxin
MAVIINDTCITCDACLQQCPVNAIVDDLSNPTGKKQYYVAPEKCVECVGLYEDPQCAAICPSIGCITWDKPFTAEFDEYFRNEEIYQLGVAKDGQLKSPLYKEKAYRTDIPLCDRGVGRVVQEEPEGEHEAG